MKKIALFLSVAMLFMSMSTTAFAASETLQELTYTTTGDGLYVGKSVTADDNDTANDNTDDTYTVTVESFTTGATVIEEDVTPIDIVLVIDDSAQGNGGGKTELQTAVNDFIDTMKADAEGYPTDTIRIAAVTFNSSSVSYAFADVNSWSKNSAGNYITLTKTGNTDITRGMTGAETLINGISASRDSDVYVVVFMDGVPNDSTTYLGGRNAALDLDEANDALETANDLKKAGVTIYTVGLFTGSDGSQINNGSETVGSSWRDYAYDDTCGAIALNRFLSFLSSNGTNISSIGLQRWSGTTSLKPIITTSSNYHNYGITSVYGGGSWVDNGYYLGSSSATELAGLFETITTAISIPDISLNSTTVVQEVVSTSFEIENGVSDVKVYTADCTTYSADADSIAWGSRTEITSVVNVSVSGNTVTVSGFDYSANFVESTQKSNGYYGQKLIVEYTVSPVDNFIGGDDISINGTGSGVYYAGELVDSIPSASVEVALTYDFSVSDYSIYLGNSISVNDILGTTVSALDGTINKDASISYQVFDANVMLYQYTVAAGNAGTTLSGTLTPTEDTTYTVTCTVSSGSMESYSPAGKSFNIDVLYPTVTTIEDIEVPLGAYVDLMTGDEYDATGAETYDSTVAGTTIAWDTATNTLNGTAPGVTLSFTDASGATYDSTTPPTYVATADNTFVVSSFVTDGTAGEVEQLSYVTFTAGDSSFAIDIMRYNLTITKTLTENANNVNYPQNFVFDVTDSSSGDVITTVVFGATGGSITINDLYVGQDITVTEDTDWSWRYTCLNDTVTVSTDRTNNDGIIEKSFANSLVNTNWLSISDMITNVFAGISA